MLLAVRGQSALLKNLSDAQIAALASEMEMLSVRQDELVLRECDPGERVFVLLSGSVEVLLQTDDGAEQQLAVMGPGDLLGEVALFFGGRRTSSARALTDCRLAGLGRDAFQRLLDADVELGGEVANHVLVRLRRSQLAAHLASLFEPLSPGMLADLEAQAQWLTLRGGDVLFRQGDAADRAFIVLSGRLGVTASADEDGAALVNEIGRGETVGEMALLSEGQRTATVFALRDTNLVAYSRTRFASLVEKYPQILMPVTQIVLRRLERDGDAYPDRRSAVATIAVVGAVPGLGLDGFTAKLMAEMEAYGDVDLLTSAAVDRQLDQPGIAQSAEHDVGNVRLVPWLVEREDRCRYLLYQADPGWSAWTERCVRQADHLLIVADASDDPAPGEMEARIADRRRSAVAGRSSLVLLQRGSRPQGTPGWLGPRSVDQHFHVRDGCAADHARVARIVTGNALGLVLGGGGARGFAHIGVLRALDELGMPIDLIGGTSMGAIIAGLFALGNDAEGIHDICRRAFVKLLDYTFPAVALLKGRRIGERCDEILGEHWIEDLNIPFFAMSTNLTRAESVVHRRGALREAVRASISIPGVLPPVHAGSDLLIDGGILNNVPDDVMRSLAGSGSVIAVDVSQPVELAASPGVDSELSGWNVLWRRCNPFARPHRTPGILSLLQRANEVRGVASRRQSPPHADLYLELPLPEWGLLDFEALEPVALRGYEMTLERLDRWRRDRSRNQPIVPPSPTGVS